MRPAARRRSGQRFGVRVSKTAAASLRGGESAQEGIRSPPIRQVRFRSSANAHRRDLPVMLRDPDMNGALWGRRTARVPSGDRALTEFRYARGLPRRPDSMSAARMIESACCQWARFPRWPSIMISANAVPIPV
jgi:hypothetical protein